MKSGVSVAHVAASSTGHRKNCPSVREHLADAEGPSASKSPGIGGHGNGRRDGEVERDAVLARVLGPQLAAAGVEAQRRARRGAARLVEHVRARERRVAAEVDLDLGREPAQVEGAVVTCRDEGRLRMPHLGRDALHPRLVAVSEHDTGRVARGTARR